MEQKYALVGMHDAVHRRLVSRMIEREYEVMAARDLDELKQLVQEGNYCRVVMDSNFGRLHERTAEPAIELCMAYAERRGVEENVLEVDAVSSMWDLDKPPLVSNIPECVNLNVCGKEEFIKRLMV